MQSGSRKEVRQEMGIWSPYMVRTPRRLPSYFYRKTDDVRSGLGNSSAVGPHLVGTVVTAFLDALYKA